MSSTSTHGYNADFIETPPDYLKCVVCQLVLRDPVVLVDCGHHYCAMCFDKVKDYAHNIGGGAVEQPVCPADGSAIDVHKVFKDIGIERIVKDLRVRCPHKCPWVGELRNLHAHASNCDNTGTTLLVASGERSRDSCCKGDSCVNTEVVRQLCERMSRCEQNMLVNEKNSLLKEVDLAQLKFQLNEARDLLDVKSKELETLKGGMTRGLGKCEMDISTNKNELEELRAWMLENQVLSSNEEPILKRDRNELEERGVKCMKVDIDEIMESNAPGSDKSEDRLSKTKITNIERDMESLKVFAEHIGKDLEGTRSGFKLNLENIKNETKLLLQDKVTNQELAMTSHELESIKSQLNYLEGISYQMSRQTTCERKSFFVWRIPEFDNIKWYNSLVFSSPEGHDCNLFLCTVNNMHALQICVTGNQHVKPTPFKCSVDVQCVTRGSHGDTEEVCNIVVPAEGNQFIRHDKDYSFKLSVFEVAKLQHYVGETLTLVCTLTKV